MDCNSGSALLRCARAYGSEEEIFSLPTRHLFLVLAAPELGNVPGYSQPSRQRRDWNIVGWRKLTRQRLPGYFSAVPPEAGLEHRGLENADPAVPAGLFFSRPVKAGLEDVCSEMVFVRIHSYSGDAELKAL